MNHKQCVNIRHIYFVVYTETFVFCKTLVNYIYDLIKNCTEYVYNPEQ